MIVYIYSDEAMTTLVSTTECTTAAEVQTACASAQYVKVTGTAPADCAMMFGECYNLLELDVSELNTSAVTSMIYMFVFCNSLTTLDLSSFDTSNVTNMGGMFYECNQLTELNISNFDTSKVNIITQMFANCSSLVTLILGDNFNTSNVTIMDMLFFYCPKLTTLDLSSFDTSKVTSMSDMFNGCSGLTTLNLKNFSSALVTSYDSMFYDSTPTITTRQPFADFLTNTVGYTGEIIIYEPAMTVYVYSNEAMTELTATIECDTLDEVHDACFDAQYVKVVGTAPADCSRMFFGCAYLKILDLSDFNTSKVTSMSQMFTDCMDLTTVNISNFDTSNVTNMFSMFDYCWALEEIIFGDNFNTSKVTNMSQMFCVCNSLTSLDLSNFDTSKVTNMANMFFACRYLTELNLSSFSATSVTSYNSMLNDATPVITTNQSFADFLTGTVGYTGEIIIYTPPPMTVYIYSDEALTTLTSKVECNTRDEVIAALTDVQYAKVTGKIPEQVLSYFSGLTSLVVLDLSELDVSNLTSMYRMFYNCTSLKTLDVSNFNTSNVTDMGSVFYNCSSLTTLDLSNFDTSKVTNMSSMFYRCSSLTSLDLSSFDTSKVTNMSSMFASSNLTSLDLSNFDTSKVTNMYCMFNACSRLTSLDVSNFDISNVTIIVYMFSGCSRLTSLDVSNFDTSNLTNMTEMFSGCTSLISLDLSSFDTSKVTNMNSMFRNCTSLETLNLLNFSSTSITTYTSMLNNATPTITTNQPFADFLVNDVGYTGTIIVPGSGDSVKFGLNDIANLYLGTSWASKMYFGEYLVYEGSEPPAPGPTPVYSLTETVFNGSTYYDTGYMLFDTSKDFTIIASFTSNVTFTSSNPPTVFHSMREVSPWAGFAFDQQNVNGRWALYSSVANPLPQVMQGNKNTVAIKHDTTAGTFTTYVLGTDGLTVTSTDITSRIRTTAFEQNLLVGAYQTTAGVKSRYFTGTVHDFELFMEALDDSTITSLMTQSEYGMMVINEDTGEIIPDHDEEIPTNALEDSANTELM